MSRTIWIAGLLLCGLGLTGIATALCVVAVNGVEVRLPQEQQSAIDRAVAGPAEVTRELGMVRQALERAEQRATSIQGAFDRMITLIEPMRSDRSIDEAEAWLQELRAGLKQVSEELRGLREDISVMRPLMGAGGGGGR
ncbi:MAG: hypothetical protein AB7K09_16480 [Planctomycetota bacterium]